MITLEAPSAPDRRGGDISGLSVLLELCHGGSVEKRLACLRAGHPHLMTTWWRRVASRPHGRTVLFLGDPAALGEVIGAATARGFGTVEIPHPALICAIADDVVLSGRGTRADAVKFLRVRELGIPCLNPEQAMAWLDKLGAVDRLATA